MTQIGEQLYCKSTKRVQTSLVPEHVVGVVIWSPFLSGTLRSQTKIGNLVRNVLAAREIPFVMLEGLTDTLFSLITSGNSYLFLLPIYGFLLFGERIAHAVFRSHEAWNNIEAASNVFLTLVFLGLNMLIGHLLPLAAMAYLYEHAHLFALSYGPVGWLAAFVLYDLAWYTDHRIAHRVGFFWAMHHVHHSCPEYNTTVASRGFLADTTLLSRPTFYLLPFLGLTPLHFMVISIATNIWGIAQHTRLVGKLPVFDLVFATPSNHRVHHGIEPKYLDRNYGETLMVWDHLFGTYQQEEEEPTYGVTLPINTSNPVRIQIGGIQWLLHKISQSNALGDKLLCLVKPPEWQPQEVDLL